jgi:predicted nucleotidyltransferase
MIDLDAEQLEVVKRLLEEHVPDVEVRVFGSRVNSRSAPYSDLDLVLVGDSKIDIQTLESLKDAFSESDLSIQVDVIDWHAISPNFRKSIESQFEVLQLKKRQANH